MNCPACNEELKMAERTGIEIDYCPKCRGIWLDRGELDKVIERSSANPGATGHPDGPHDDHRYRSRHDEGHGDCHHRHRPDYRAYKKKSLLKDLFDF